MRARLEGFLVGAVLWLGCGAYFWFDGTRGTVLYAFMGGLAVLMILPALPIWSRWKGRTGRIAEAAVSADGALLHVRRAGGHRSARRLVDGAEVRAPAPAPPARPADEVVRATELLYGDVARLWLDGGDRRVLHGLQPQPAERREFLRGELVATAGLRDAPSAPLLVLVQHVEKLDYRSPELLTRVDLAGGAEVWTARFAPPTLARATHLFVTPDQLTFVLDTSPPGALALDAATGAVRWTVTL